jgi:hypothetical protein
VSGKRPQGPITLDPRLGYRSSHWLTANGRDDDPKCQPLTTRAQTALPSKKESDRVFAELKVIIFYLATETAKYVFSPR